MNDVQKRTMLLAGLGVGAALAGAALAGRRRAGRYDFRGKVVLITGGSRGLGLVLAREFGAEGARLALCARDGEELERAREDLAGRGIEVLPITCDVTDPDQVEAMMGAVRRRYGQVDVLVNNAGVIQVGPMETMRREDFENALKIHFWGPYTMVQAVLPQMRERGEGRIVNVSSIGGKVAFPHLLPYTTSKFALVGFSEGLHAELAKEGIPVTTVIPGLMRTGSPPNAWFKGDQRAEYAWFTLADSLPGSSVSAEKAARQIVGACRRGDAELIISLPAQAAVALHGLFPGLTTELLAAVNPLLPSADGAGPEAVRGREAESPVTRSPLTGLTQEAAWRNNQMG